MNGIENVVTQLVQFLISHPLSRYREAVGAMAEMAATKPFGGFAETHPCFDR